MSRTKDSKQLVFWSDPAQNQIYTCQSFQIPPNMAYVLRDYMTRIRPVPTESMFHDPHMLITQKGRWVPDLARFIITSNSMKTDR